MAQSGSGSSRTPFDEDLIHDPHAPRDTQPLTPLTNAPTPQANAPIPQNTAPTYATPRHLPPQVVTNNLDDDTDPSPPRRVTKKLPLTTLIGLALVAGALGTVLVSAVVRRVLPRPAPIVYVPEGTPPAGMPGSAPRIVMQPPGGNETIITRGSEGTTSQKPSSQSRGATATEETRRQTVVTNDRVPTSSDFDPESEEESTTQNSRTTRSSGNTSDQNSNNRDNDSASRSSRFTSSRGYAITPPPGFRLQRSGRRTEWRGPNGEQLLVETGSPNGSPRAGWERLDKALSKKYGSKYRSRGISETTLAGQPAAVWEFEIDTPSGTQRKVDIAVHSKGRGYAVLGAAPAEKFDEVRPKIEAAIRSFELRNEEMERASASSRTNSSTRRNSRRSETRSRPEDRNSHDADPPRDIYPRDTFPEESTEESPTRSQGY